MITKLLSTHLKDTHRVATYFCKYFMFLFCVFLRDCWTHVDIVIIFDIRKIFALLLNPNISNVFRVRNTLAFSSALSSSP